MASFSNFKSTIVAASNEVAGATTGVTIYAARSNLPVSGNNTGDQAYVTGNNRLYIWNGSGWYNVALLNLAPSISSVQDSDGNTTPFVLSTVGTPTTITITAADSDGDPITYEAVADSDFSGLATVSQESNVFTITPFSLDSATTTSGTITFTATDGINTASSGVQTFTLNFLSALWDETVLSIGTSSTNSLDNSTFIDRSTNGHTVTPSGSPVQTAFHPYLDNWSVKFESGIHHLKNDGGSHFGSADFTIEAWVNPTAPSVTTSTRGIITQYANTGVSGSAWIFGIGSNSGSSTKVRIWYNYNTSTESSASLELNQWSHIAWTREGSTNKIFINGELDTTFTNSTDYSTNTYQTEIGTWNTDEADRHFQGFISNVRVVDGTALYTSTFTPPTDKLTAITNTTILACHSNRFLFEGSLDSAGWSIVGTPEISALNPFGQDSEYAVGENKGSVRNTIQSTSNVKIDTPITLPYSTSWTIEFWVYVEGLGSTNEGILISQYELTSANRFMLNFGINSGLKIRIFNNGSSSWSSNLQYKEWNHIAFCHTANVGGELFINGISDATLNYGGIYAGDTMQILSLAADVNGAFLGYISDFKYTEGSTVYTSNFTPPTAPVGNTNASLYLPFDNAGIFDKTGINTLTPVGNASTSTTQTKFADTSLVFDGSGDYLFIPSDPVFDMGNGNFTIECWAYPVSTTAGAIIRTANNSSFGGWAISWSGSSSSKFKMLSSTNGTSWLVNVDASSVSALNTWHHVALVRNGTSLTLYVNGISQANSTALGTNSVLGGLPVYIGWSSFQTEFLNGYIENLQILKGVAKYTANFTPPISTQGRTYQAES